MAVVISIFAGTASGAPPTPIIPVADDAFTRVAVPPVVVPPASEPPVEIVYEPLVVVLHPRPTARPLLLQPTPAAKAVTLSEPAIPSNNGSLRGKASWYCSVEKPICHYQYPPGSMVAAACGKLRRAMGSDWRGTTVNVYSHDTHKSVNVKLVDWCGSEDKTIDLYWAPMSRLGGTGVLDVTVRW